MKKILIGVVVVLLIAGVIGGSFVLANHFKKPEEKVDDVVEVPVETSVTACLSQGQIVDKLYVNMSSNATHARLAEISADIYMLRGNIQNTFTDDQLSSANIDATMTELIKPGDVPVVVSFGVDGREGDYVEIVSYDEVNHEGAYCEILFNEDGTVNYVQSECVKKPLIKYDYDTGVIDLCGECTIFIPSDLIQKIMDLNIISTKPYPEKVDNAETSGNNSSSETVAMSETSCLESQQVIDYLYINPRFEWTNEKVEFIKSFKDNAVIGFFANEELPLTDAELIEVFNKDNTYVESIPYRVHYYNQSDLRISNYAEPRSEYFGVSLVFNTSVVTGEDGIINQFTDFNMILPADPYERGNMVGNRHIMLDFNNKYCFHVNHENLVINPAVLEQFRALNLISTVPYLGTIPA